MKRILITGVNSYIGNAVEQHLMEYNAREGREMYRVDKISLRNETIENISFAMYDTVFHVAGIAHADIGKVSEETKALYYQVNCDLAVQAAKKAKTDGVSQFIYLSSVIVYGDSAKVGESKHITADTLPTPANFYGDSKWQAEQKLSEIVAEGQADKVSAVNNLSDVEVADEQSNFCLAILRLPMIYGKGSKGNFPLLMKLAKATPVFPNIQNRRSMLYVEHLAEFTRLLIESGKGGIFFPQEKEYITTVGLVKAIGEAQGKRIYGWTILNPFVKLLSKLPGKMGGMMHKAFGSFTIDKGLSEQGIGDYHLYSPEESIRRTI